MSDECNKDATEPFAEAHGSAWVDGKTGMGIFDGSIHDVTYRAQGEGESDEGWSTAESASGERVLLQIYGRHGDQTRISLTAQQAWALKIRLEYASLELTRRAQMPNAADQQQAGGRTP